MQRLAYDSFLADIAAYDRAVAGTPHVDAFCSSSDWILAARGALHGANEPWVYGDGERYVPLMRRWMPGIGHLLSPFEAMWGLACPLIGPEPGPLAELLAERLVAEGEHWDVALLSGVPSAHAALQPVVRALGRRRLQVRPAGRMVRYVADLSGGLDGFLRERSAKFRANVRRAERKALAHGVRFLRYAPPGADAARRLFERILAIERRSWKALEGNGVDQEPMRGFTAGVVTRAAAEQRFVAIIATVDEQDVGYIHGATRGDLYRGLQVSFDDAFRDLSLGNVLQLQMIRWLCEMGVSSYDLGSELEYKKRWGEPGLETLSLVVTPSPGFGRLS